MKIMILYELNSFVGLVSLVSSNQLTNQQTNKQNILKKGGDSYMGKIIMKNAVKREKGCMYYVDGKGNLCEAKMAKGGKRKKK